MRVQNRILDSRISKRIFTTFVLCALVPVVCMAVLVYLQVTRQIRQETFVNLRLAAKTQAKILTDRLLSAEKELALVSPLADNAATDPVAGLPGSLVDRLSKTFSSITVFAPVDRPHVILGRQPIDSLALRPDDLRHLAKGATLLKELNRGPSAIILLLVRPLIGAVDATGYVVGEIDVDRFWQADMLDNLPLDTGFCVFGFSASLLYPSGSRMPELVDRIRTGIHSAVSGHFEVDTAAGRYVASHTQLFLKPEFKLPHWDVVLYKSTADVFAPVDDFKFIFTMVLLLAFVVVLWLSLVNIRKNLVPIDALKTGIDRIADKDFSHRVDVRSGDELEELADAFNRMSAQLQKKFSEMKLIAGLGAHITTILDVDELTQAVIDSIEQRLDFDRVAILLADVEGYRATVNKQFGFHFDAIEQLRNLKLRPDGAQPSNPISAAYTSQQPVLISGDADTGEFNFLQGQGAQAMACIPLVYEGASLGVMVLARAVADDGPIQDGDTEVLAGIAAQTAVSLANIDAFRQVRESEQRFRAAFDYSAGGILFVAPGGELLRCNAFFCSMLGYARDELLSKPYSEIVHPNHLAENLAALDRMIQGNPNADSFESRYVHKDGGDVWGFVSTSLLLDPSGGPLYFIILVQDLTAEKKSQEEKRILQSQLQQSQKMEAIGTLAGGIAHDFNNILMAIYGYTQISMMKAEASGATDLNAHLEKIMAASERAKALVNQILTFSRRGASEIKPIDVNPVIKETIKLLRATIPPNIEIKQRLTGAPSMVMADANQIHQVMMNLCTNAYHAVMEKGTGSISVDVMVENDPPVDVPAVNVGGSGPFSTPSAFLKISIADNGYGMDAETMEKIFEPYYTTKAEGKGTGLGLAVVHGIINNHGGVITVDSRPGDGTTFDIYLPITEEKSASDPRSPAYLPAGSERLLVVDDETDVTNICDMMLTDLGYTVTCLNRPMDALIAFQSNPDGFDLVITDMAMPRMMGDELARQLTAVKPGIPILCMTGYNELVKSKPERGALFSGFIDKPFAYEQLANAVRDALDTGTLSVDGQPSATDG